MTDLNSTCRAKALHSKPQPTQAIRRGFVVGIFVVLILVGCKEVSYRDPQPKGLRELPHVPTKLQGSYLFKEDNDIDTIVITKDRFYARSDKKKDDYVLSDSLVMKTYKGYYFINKKSHETWLLRVVKQEKNGDISYLDMDDENFNPFLARLSTQIRIDSTDTSHGMVYMIDPSPKELMDLIEKNYFVKRADLKKLK